MKAVNVIGDTYGRWTIIEEILPRKRPRKFLCQCTCGTKRQVQLPNLRGGISKSCGCLKTEKSTTHGQSKNRLYSIWRGMKGRCLNPNAAKYHNYGGKGIRIYTAWVDSFETFQTWALNNGYSAELSLDREKGNMDYSPGNCRWVTLTVQSRNRLKGRKPTSSKYMGVSWNKPRELWIAAIRANKRDIYIGGYPTEILAAQARDNYIIENQLEHFILNFS